VRLTGVQLLDQVLGGAAAGLPLVLTGPIGSGRTVLCLELAGAALGRGERVVFVTRDPASVLLRQAESLGMAMAEAIRSEELALLELVPQAGALLRVHGAAPLREALRAEAPDAGLVVLDGLRPLVQDLLDVPVLRAALETLLAGWEAPDQLVVASADSDLLRRLQPLEEVLADLCGALVDLELEPDGARWLAVRKSRFGSARTGRVRFELSGRGARVVEEPPDAPDPTPEAVATLSPARIPADPAPPPAPERRPRIAVIDGDAAARAQVRDWLGERYEVLEAADGFEALTAVLAEKPDAMVLELVLPRISGYEVLRACQKARAQLPVLCLSARLLRAADRIRPLVLGASDLMAKPPNRVELLHRVESLLRAAPLRRVDGPEEPPDLLFVAATPHRGLEEVPFRERASRAFGFGERFGVPSSLAAVVCAKAEDRAAFLAAADALLRAEDAVLALGSRRALLLLVACDPKAVEAVVRRIEARARASRKRMSAVVSVALPLDREGDVLDLSAAFGGSLDATDDEEKEAS
jgi:CheY-like chemotaxis protein/KaiC/GvpD/RAD55 family RecA-like ATPase